MSKVLDETIENLEFIKEAIDHYESALKSAFPTGASGHVFHHWNEARKFLGWVGSKPMSIAKDEGKVMDKELALDLMQLLSALESAFLVHQQQFPGYLFENISDSLDKLRVIVLEKKGKTND